MIAPDVIEKAKVTERIADWIDEEMKDAELKDKRLNRRLKLILSDLARHPTASIPAASGGYPETAAAYRFFDNEKVTFERVLLPHVIATRPGSPPSRWSSWSRTPPRSMSLDPGSKSKAPGRSTAVPVAASSST